MRRPVDVEFSWIEAANLLVAALQADTRGWTPASRGHLQRAIDKLAAVVPMDDPNAMFLVVRGQTPARRLVPPSYEVRKKLREATLAVGRAVRRRRRS